MLAENNETREGDGKGSFLTVGYVLGPLPTEKHLAMTQSSHNRSVQNTKVVQTLML